MEKAWNKNRLAMSQFESESTLKEDRKLVIFGWLIDHLTFDSALL